MLSVAAVFVMPAVTATVACSAQLQGACEFYLLMPAPRRECLLHSTYAGWEAPTSTADTHIDISQDCPSGLCQHGTERYVAYWSRGLIIVQAEARPKRCRGFDHIRTLDLIPGLRDAECVRITLFLPGGVHHGD
jgi:hypothetical protein